MVSHVFLKPMFVLEFQFADTIIGGKIMTVISRTHQVPIKIGPLFWKMIIIGCTTIIIVAVDRGSLEVFFKCNPRYKLP